MRSVLVLLVVLSTVWACSPPQCDPVVPVVPYTSCRVVDGGVVGSPFVVAYQSAQLIATCTAVVDGGSITLVLPAVVPSVCSAPTNSGAAPVPPSDLPCVFPALDAGTYFVNSSPVSTITVPSDGGVIHCD